MIYFLTVTNPQGEKTTFNFANVPDCENLMETIMDTDNCCKFEIFTDEWMIIKNSHKRLEEANAVQEKH